MADTVINALSGWIPAESWALLFADPSGRLDLVSGQALEPPLDPALSQIAQWAVSHGQEFMAADLARDARIDRASPSTIVGLPLRARGRTMGALIGIDRMPSASEPRLSPAVLGSLVPYLEAAAIALDNAVRVQRAEALSVTDDLTHLYNSRFLDQSLRRETKRASRSGRPLSLLFIDLDGFKSINDTHGHLSGSRALVEAAAVIRTSARETDVVARFGGDEFALVLPDTGSDGAVSVADRVRTRIAEHPFLAVDGLDIRLTASVGIATLPDAARTAEELLSAADAAMYRVKETGKNGIHLAERSAG